MPLSDEERQLLIDSANVTSPVPGSDVGTDAAGRFTTGLEQGLLSPAQKLASLLGASYTAQNIAAQRQADLQNPLYRTNPEYDKTFIAGAAEGLGRAIPDVGLSLIPGIGIPALFAKQGLGTAQNIEEAQQAYDEAAARGEAPEGERPGMLGGQIRGALETGAFLGAGKLAAPFLAPALSAAPGLLRPLTGVALHGATNVAADTAIRAATNNGVPFANPSEFGQSVAAGFAFGVPGGIHQAGAVRDVSLSAQAGAPIPVNLLKASGLRVPENYTKDGDFYRPQTSEEKIAKATTLLPNATRTAQELTKSTEPVQTTQATQAAAENLAEETLKPPQAGALPTVPVVAPEAVYPYGHPLNPVRTVDLQVAEVPPVATVPPPLTTQGAPAGTVRNFKGANGVVADHVSVPGGGWLAMLSGETAEQALARHQAMLKKFNPSYEPPAEVPPVTIPAEPVAPTPQLSPEQKIQVVTTRMREMEANLGFNEDAGELSSNATPKERRQYQALQDEFYRLTTGNEPPPKYEVPPDRTAGAPPAFTEDVGAPPAPAERPAGLPGELAQEPQRGVGVPGDEGVTGVSGEAPVPLDETRITPETPTNEAPKQEPVGTADNAGPGLENQRGTGPLPNEGVAGGEQPKPTGPEGEGVGVQSRTEPGLTAAESTEYDANRKEQAALFNKRKLTPADEKRIDELQTRADELDAAARGDNTLGGPKVPRLDMGKLAKKGVAIEDLDRANKHVADVLVPRAHKVMEAVAGEPVKLVVAPRNNRGFGVGLAPDGTLEFHTDPDAGANLRSYRKSDGKTSAYARKNLGEEIIHAAQLVGIRNIWRKLDPSTRGNAEEFAINYVKNITAGIRARVAELRAAGEDAKADKLEASIEGSNNLYSLSRVPADGASLLESWEANPEHGYKRLLELGRQFEQEARDGTITETFLNRVLVPVGNWIKESYRALRAGLGLAKGGGFGPEFDQLFKDTQRHLLGRDITLKEALPQRTIDALDGLNLKWGGTQGGIGKVKSFNLFTPTDLPANESTTFAAPLGVTPEQLRARREAALLPFNERKNNSGLGQATPPIPQGAAPKERLPGSSTIRADGNGIRTIEGPTVPPGDAGRRESTGAPEGTPEAPNKEGGSGMEEVAGGARGEGARPPVRSEANTGAPLVEPISDQGRSPQVAGFGEVPIPAKPIGKVVDAVLDKVDKYAPEGAKKLGLRAFFRGKQLTRQVRQDIRQMADGKDTSGDVLAKQDADNIRRSVGFDKSKEEQILPVREAGGSNIGKDGYTEEIVRDNLQEDIDKLQHALANPEEFPKANRPVMEKMLDVWNKAKTNFNDLIKPAERTGEFFDEKLGQLKAADIAVGERDNYVTRLLEKRDDESSLIPEALAGSGRGNTSAFKGRTHETLVDSVLAGNVPKTLNVADIAEHYSRSANGLIGEKALQAAFQTTVDPQTKQPVMIPTKYERTKLVKYGPKDPETGDQAVRQVSEGGLEPGYVRIQGPMGTELTVHKGYADVFKALYNPSALTSDAAQAAKTLAALLKHGNLAIDTFHAGRQSLKAFFNIAANNSFKAATDLFINHLPSIKEGGKLGKWLGLRNVDPRYADEAAARGEITPEGAEFIKSPEAQEELRLQKQTGAGIGINWSNLYGEIERGLNKWEEKLPTFLRTPVEYTNAFLKGSTHYIFQRLGPALYMSTWSGNFRRNLELMHPDFKNMSPEEQSSAKLAAAKKTSRELDEAFGNLRNQAWIKSKTGNDIGNILFLAHRFVNSQIMTEARGYGQLAESVKNAAWGKKLPNGQRERVFALGNMGNFALRTGLSLFALNQAINLATRQQFTWQNQEDGHKLDAWIPGGPGSNGFFFSPLSVPAEYVHTLMNYGKYQSFPDALAHIGANKLSPMASAAKTAITGKDYAGKQLGPGERFAEAGKQLVPLPIGVGGAAKALFSPTQKRGAIVKQAAQSVGLKLDQAPDAVSQAYDAFKKYRKPGQPTDFAPSPHKDLRSLVQNEAAPEKIKAEVDRLIKDGKTKQGIITAFSKEFHPSGSVIGDMNGIRAEGNKLQSILVAAKKQKQTERDYLTKALQSK